MRKSMNGYEALVEAAILGGCRSVCARHLTPPEEIIKAASIWMPRVGGIVLQPESEFAAIERAYQEALDGLPVLLLTMGIESSALLEGITHLAAAEIPCVIAYTARHSREVTIQNSEDHLQILKGNGNGGYRYIVLVPSSVQEVADLTIRAFDLADRYSNPVVIVIDEVLGEMSESIDLPETCVGLEEKPRVEAMETKIRRSLLNRSLFQNAVPDTEASRFEQKFQDIGRNECSWEEYGGDYADTLVIVYGITSQAVRTAVDLARNQGIRARMFRPVSLYPFPSRHLSELSKRSSSILVVELGRGQLLRIVQSSIGIGIPMCHISAAEGMPPTASDVLAVLGRAGVKYAS